MVRDTWHHCLYPLGLSINCSRGRRPLYGLNTCLGWPIRPIALVSGIEILNFCTHMLIHLRSLAYQLIMELPRSNTLVPVALPTLYLWIVDTLALRRGTWVIESGTKLGWHLWDGLEIEYVYYIGRWVQIADKKTERPFSSF